MHLGNDTDILDKIHCKAPAITTWVEPAHILQLDRTPCHSITKCWKCAKILHVYPFSFDVGWDLLASPSLYKEGIYILVPQKSNLEKYWNNTSPVLIHGYLFHSWNLKLVMTCIIRDVLCAHNCTGCTACIHFGPSSYGIYIGVR